ncbi:MAG: aspartoacylase [Myxococcota bacterium]
MNERVERVVVVGGTHGNERTGVVLARRWQRDPAEITRPSFDTTVLVGNPEAIEHNVRYLDQDLNRCFAASALEALATDRESARAKVVAEQILAVDPNRQALFDLHTTVCPMGTTVILMDPSPFNLGLVASLQRADSRVQCFYWHAPGREPVHLNGLCPRGIAVEVGAVAHGTVRADVLEATRTVLAGALDYVEAWNRGQRNAGEEAVLHRFVRNVDFPRDADGEFAALVHPERQDQNFVPLSVDAPLFVDLDGRTIGYDGEPGLCPIFINEAAYYEVGVAMSLTERITMRVPA